MTAGAGLALRYVKVVVSVRCQVQGIRHCMLGNFAVSDGASFVLATLETSL